VIRTNFKRLLADRSGTSAIEMGLICALIVLAMMTALTNFADESELTWTMVAQKTSDAIQSSAN